MASPSSQGARTEEICPGCGAVWQTEADRYREALHTICGLTDQDIDEEPFWRLVSRIHHVARAAVDPPAKETS